MKLKVRFGMFEQVLIKHNLCINFNILIISMSVVALKSIQDTYKLIRINWQGDPCVPQHLMWDGLTCNDTTIFISPRVTSL